MASKFGIPPMAGVMFGIVFYELSETITYLLTPVFIPTLFRLIGLVIILYSISRSKFQSLTGGISSVFSLFFLWSLFLLLRGSLMGNFLPGNEGASFVSTVQNALLKPYGAAAILLPFLSLMHSDLNSLYYLKRSAIVLSVIAIVIVFLSRDQIINSINTFGLTTLTDAEGEELSVRHFIVAIYPGLGIILFGLFSYGFVKSRFSIVLPISVAVLFLCYAIAGGRGMTVFALLYLLGFFYLQYKNPIVLSHNRENFFSKIRTRRFTVLFIGVLFILLLVFLFYNTGVFDYVLERAFGGKTLSGDFQNESREILVKDFIRDFNEHPFDWIWGRGVNGSYATGHLSTNGRRAWMELSYYYLILKGGVIYLFFFIYCLLHASYLGFFKSNNAFSKCLAMMCIMLLLNMASSGAEPRFSTQFVLSWFCFGLLERKSIRVLNDEDIYGYFNHKNYTAK